MRPSLRFLGLALTGWIGIRAAMLGAIPGADVFTLRQGTAVVPEGPAVDSPTITPSPPADPEAAELMRAAMPLPPAPLVDAARTMVSLPQPYYPVAYAAAPRMASYVYRPSRARRSLPIVEASLPFTYAPYSVTPPYPTSEEYPVSRMAATAYTPLGPAPTTPARSIPDAAKAKGFDRLQLTGWAMLRGRRGLTSSPASLASGGTLGASQAGARLTYYVTRNIAASVRTTSTIGRRGGEMALGARVQPVRGIPVWVTAERRFALGKDGDGRNAFALFFEGGLWGQPLPMHFMLDAYLQGGVVGLKRRDGFIDGAATATRPVYRNFSAGLGIWGAAQPGVSRLDAGPRVTMKVRNNIKVHLDYRYKVAGNAQPGSGPVITLAGDF
jgi:hypothetical protein